MFDNFPIEPNVLLQRRREFLLKRILLTQWETHNESRKSFLHWGNENVRGKRMCRILCIIDGLSVNCSTHIKPVGIDFPHL